MATWLDLKDAIRASGRIPYEIVASIAHERACREEQALRRAGLTVPFERLLEHERVLVTTAAATTLDDLATARMLARVSPAERAARAFDLKAELAETAIPPRPTSAALYRECAAECRAASYMQAAE